MKHFYFNSKGLVLSLLVGFLSLVYSDSKAAVASADLVKAEEAVEAKLGASDIPTKHVTEDGKIVPGAITNGERVQLALKILNKVLAIIEYAPEIDFPGIETGIRGFLGGGKYSETILRSDLIKILELIRDIFADKDSVFVSLARIVPSKKVHAVAHRVEDMGKSLNTLIDTLMVAKKMAALSAKPKNADGTPKAEAVIVVPTAPEVIVVTDDELDFS